MSKQTKLALILGVIILIIIGISWRFGSSQAPVQVLETKEQETVNFCGASYRMEKTVIDGIDLTPQIAGIATANPGNLVCANLKLNISPSELIRTTVEPVSGGLNPNSVTISTIGNRSNGPTFFYNKATRALLLMDAFGDTSLGIIK